MKRLLFLLPLLLCLPANGQSLWRNFFTTNQNPQVTVVAGSNATVQASTVGVNQRIFTVNSTATGGAQTNISYTAVTNAPWQWGYSGLTNLSNNNGGSLTNLQGTNIVGPINGITAIGPILTTSSSSNSPAATELATAGWVRNLFDGFGVSYYVTTNIASGFTNLGVVTAFPTVYEFSASIPVHNQRTYTGVTNGGYFGFVTTTNTFLQLNSGVTVNSYIESLNGSGTAGPAVKPEIYISYDKTNWFCDWDAQPQYITEGGTNLWTWIIANPNYTSTNSTGFYVQRRLKMVTQTTPAASDVVFHLGTNMASHIALSGASSSSGNAYLAANNTFTGTNTFTQPIFGNGAGITNLNASELRSGSLSLNSSNYLGTVGSTNFMGNGANISNVTANATVTLLDCSTGLVRTVLSSRYPTVLLKSNANYNAEIVANGITNTIAGLLTWVDVQPIASTNWILRW